MAIDPNLITTTRVGELPTSLPTLTSKLPHEVGTDLNYFTISELVSFLAPLVSALDYQVIELDVPQQFIIDNFDVTGLGTNLMLGYAICNGNNGTKNRDGRVGIGYGTNYSTVGITGGSATHTLTESEMPIHSHGCPSDGGSTFSSGINFRRETDNAGNIQTNTAGGGQAHNNMQPYLVTLMIMKL